MVSYRAVYTYFDENCFPCTGYSFPYYDIRETPKVFRDLIRGCELPGDYKVIIYTKKYKDEQEARHYMKSGIASKKKNVTLANLRKQLENV